MKFLGKFFVGSFLAIATVLSGYWLYLTPLGQNAFSIFFYLYTGLGGLIVFLIYLIVGIVKQLDHKSKTMFSKKDKLIIGISVIFITVTELARHAYLEGYIYP